MVKINIKNVLFGKYETFEGDPFFWMADFATLYMRSRLQDKYIATTIFWIYNLCIFIFIIHFNKANNRMDLIINDYAFIGTMLESQIMYGLSIGGFPEFNRVYIALGHLVKDNEKHPDRSLKTQMIKISKKLKFMVIIVHLIIMPLSFYLFVGCFTTNTQPNLPQKFIINFVTKRHDLYNILYILFLALNMHTILYMKMPMCVILYISAHITFVLKHLAKAMKNMQQIDKEFENIMDCLNSDEYQKKVREELLYFLKRHIEIKRIVTNINECVLHYRYFTYVLTIALAIGCDLLMVVKTSGNILGSLGVSLIFVYTAVLAAECGEQVRIQCDIIYNQAQQFAWYKWNKENCKLLMMLLFQTKTPMEFKYRNITTISRLGLLSLFRISYSTVMFFNTT